MNDWMRDMASGKIEDLPDPFESWQYQPEPEVGDIGVQIEKIDPAPEYFDEGSASHTCSSGCDPAEEMMEFGKEMADSAAHMCSSGCDPTAHMNREEKRAFKRSFRKKGRQ